ncbi:MAG: threonine/serine dehydratase [Nitrospiraceae bacterium]
MSIVTPTDIGSAVERLRGNAVVTPVVTSAELDAQAGARVFLKCEQQQRTGSFKFRGAFNAVASLPPETAGTPVVTVSSGNHGQALALAARLHNRAAIIYAPGAITPTKRHAILAQGGTLVECVTRAEAEAAAAARAQSGDAMLIHPFNDLSVIAGQGTCALEVLDHVGELDAILAPVGGGGLLSGTCLAAHGRNPRIAVYGCEPVGALDAVISVREGRIVPMTNPQTIADGLRSSLGTHTLEILRAHVADFFTVEEWEIVEALRYAHERLGLWIEPSSAVALAPLLRGEPALQNRRVAVILTGGNIDEAGVRAILGAKTSGGAAREVMRSEAGRSAPGAHEGS